MKTDLPRNTSFERFTLIGFPVEHSLSPLIHNAAFMHFNLPYHYMLTPVEKEGLGRCVSFLKRKCFGFNVTAPYKVAILPYLDRLDEAAVDSGAVNAVKNENGLLVGYNFDGVAALSSLTKAGIRIEGKCVLLLGAGGAASSIATSLVRRFRNSFRLLLLNRTPENASLLAERLSPLTSVTVVSPTESSIKDSFVQANILINTTGVKGCEGLISCVCDSLRSAKELELVFDITYSQKTSLLEESFSAGIKTLDGADMLVGQAALSFKLWTGLEPPLGVMENAFVGGLLRNIVLIGFTGVGKTTVAQKLSQETGRAYVSTDMMVEKEAGRSITHIFRHCGEEKFRQIETQIVSRLCELRDSVIDCGGGVVLNPANVNALRRTGIIVWLAASEEESLRRVFKGAHSRPLVNGKTREEVLRLYKEREPIYSACASIKIDTTSLSPQESASRIRKVVESVIWRT
ncbi:MAG: shikimate dehydrogenase [Planctomycetota bacterium]|nr:shikimate dehydrogenase [Planctomycetota bacterium]